MLDSGHILMEGSKGFAPWIGCCTLEREEDRDRAREIDEKERGRRGKREREIERELVSRKTPRIVT